MEGEERGDETNGRYLNEPFWQRETRADARKDTAAARMTLLRSCRSYYIMCMMAITFLNLIGIPMEIAFLDGHSGLVWEGFNVFSDTLFLIDVALNFRMGIITDDCEVRAARLYFRIQSGGL